ncbi:MAG: hypothetical protein J6C79_02575 [Clostridia bacterium]|nr:hypothetical protein [Clostridia bacterium]
MKKTKLLATTLALALTAALFPTVGNVSASADELSAADAYFLDFVSDDLGDAEITYQSSPLYDETLEQNGYEYVFEADGQSGFALIHEIELGNAIFYELEELSYNGVSPFAESEGLPVYITFCLYLDYVDGAFYNLETGAVVGEETLAAATATRFGYQGGGSHYIEQSYTITYDHKTVTESGIQYAVPNYSPATGTSCANAAGAILLGYYDRFYPELIPNFQTYLVIGTGIVYRMESEEVQDAMVELRTLMGTDDTGTTYTGFNAGMTSYVQSKGYTYTITSLFTNNTFDFARYKTTVDGGTPVAFFLNGYAMAATVEGDGEDTINNSISGNTHVAIGYGYKEDIYYDANNNVISTQRFIRVSSGLAIYGLCYFNMNYGTINKAIAVTIA